MKHELKTTNIYYICVTIRAARVTIYDINVRLDLNPITSTILINNYMIIMKICNYYFDMFNYERKYLI